ncbi:rRNA adenine N-6-methyltransferase family protein, partial [Alistipes sp. CHKCI003]|uniref:rRNA adenine N-6-methyltransferase family protein n=2 Tax=Alistipes TaxID=239759 RepID=UPI001CD21E12
NCLTLRKIILLKTVKGFCCLMQEIKNGIDRTHLKRKHLFFDFKFKAKYLAFISCLLEKPDLSVKTALKSIFRKSQVRSISEKFGLNLNAQIVCLSPSQWLNCFLEMLEVVPEKFHPS